MNFHTYTHTHACMRARTTRTHTCMYTQYTPSLPPNIQVRIQNLRTNATDFLDKSPPFKVGMGGVGRLSPLFPTVGRSVCVRVCAVCLLPNSQTTDHNYFKFAVLCARTHMHTQNSPKLLHTIPLSHCFYYLSLVNIKSTGSRQKRVAHLCLWCTVTDYSLFHNGMDLC